MLELIHRRRLIKARPANANGYSLSGRSESSRVERIVLFSFASLSRIENISVISNNAKTTASSGVILTRSGL